MTVSHFPLGPYSPPCTQRPAWSLSNVSWIPTQSLSWPPTAHRSEVQGLPTTSQALRTLLPDDACSPSPPLLSQPWPQPHRSSHYPANTAPLSLSQGFSPGSCHWSALHPRPSWPYFFQTPGLSRDLTPPEEPSPPAVVSDPSSQASHTHTLSHVFFLVSTP